MTAVLVFVIEVTNVWDMLNMSTITISAGIHAVVQLWACILQIMTQQASHISTHI